MIFPIPTLPVQTNDEDRTGLLKNHYYCLPKFMNLLYFQVTVGEVI